MKEKEYQNGHDRLCADENLIRDLLGKLKQAAEKDVLDDECFYEQMRQIILIAADILKNRDIRMYIPFDEDGPLFYEVEDKLFCPAYTSEDVLGEGIERYGLIDAYTIFETAYNSEAFAGVIIDPFSDHVFVFEDWVLGAVLFRYMNVDTFKLYAQDGKEIMIW